MLRIEPDDRNWYAGFRNLYFMGGNFMENKVSLYVYRNGEEHYMGDFPDIRAARAFVNKLGYKPTGVAMSIRN